MVKFRRYLAILSLFLASSTIAEENERLSFDFRVFGVGKDSFEGLFYFTGERYEALSFHRTHRSAQKYSYSGKALFQAHVKNMSYDPNDPASIEFLPVASTLPSSAREQLVVFVAHSKNREVTAINRKFTLFSINDTPQHFERNTVIILNTTGVELFGRIDSEDIRLPPGPSKPVRYSAKGRSKTRIVFALETQGEVKLVMSNDVNLANNRRYLIILEPPRRKGSFRVAVRVLAESVFPAPTE